MTDNYRNKCEFTIGFNADESSNNDFCNLKLFLN